MSLRPFFDNCKKKAAMCHKLARCTYDIIVKKSPRCVSNLPYRDLFLTFVKKKPRCVTNLHCGIIKYTMYLLCNRGLFLTFVKKRPRCVTNLRDVLTMFHVLMWYQPIPLQVIHASLIALHQNKIMSALKKYYDITNLPYRGLFLTFVKKKLRCVTNLHCGIFKFAMYLRCNRGLFLTIVKKRPRCVANLCSDIFMYLFMSYIATLFWLL